ncbi:MAG: NAD(P)-dependent alcohol dehydrogenase [Actinobacteria bacterium]|nr:NAD(P)-dependent alcohol dehydrogenase [Actinomycetota bacterium]
MKTIAAVVHEAGGPFSLEDVVLDEPRADEVLVRMVATGLCHTDLSVRAGYIPFPLPGVMGHEGAGVVEAVGSAVKRVAPGDHVLATFTSCGQCANCTGGEPAYCHTFIPSNLIGGTRSDGSYTIHQGGAPINAHFFGQSTLARHALIDERSLVKVAHDAPLATLAPLGCGIQTGVGTVLNVLCPEPGSSVVVFGVGGVGLAAIMGAALTGAVQIIAVDVVPSRLELALELGATHVVDARDASVVEAVRELSAGQGVNYTIECTGIIEVAGQAVQVLAPLGTCALVGAPPTGSTLPIDVQFMLDGRRVVGVTEGASTPESFIPALVDLHGQGKLPLERLIRCYPFEDIEQAAADASSGATIKPVLVFD